MMEIFDPDLERRFKVVAVLIGYPYEALLFVQSGWTDYEHLNQAHVDGKTLCWRLHDHALKSFGQDAQQQLESWGITSTSDFGNLVYGMMEHGLIWAVETDKRDDFENVFTFDDQFIAPKFKNEPVLKHWKLSTLFLATTLAAIVLSGFTRSGAIGAIKALYAGWFVVLGAACIIIGLLHRFNGRLLLVSFGIICLVVGLFAFSTVSYW